jgi:hypothetical protein
MEGVKNIVCQLVTVLLIRLLVPGSAHPATTQPGPACEAHLLPWLSTQSFVFLTSHARSESRPEAGECGRRDEAALRRRPPSVEGVSSFFPQL